MNDFDSGDIADLIDLAGRLMLTHAIGLDHAMRLLDIDRAEAEVRSIPPAAAETRRSSTST